MKKSIAFLTALLFGTMIAFAQQATDDFTGKWKTEDGNFISISKRNGKFIGLDGKNRETLYNIHFDDGKWKGIAENHEKGNKANCEIYLLENKIKMVAHRGFYTKTFIWTKVQ